MTVNLGKYYDSIRAKAKENGVSVSEYIRQNLSRDLQTKDGDKVNFTFDDEPIDEPEMLSS